MYLTAKKYVRVGLALAIVMLGVVAVQQSVLQQTTPALMADGSTKPTGGG
jgi:hypothetical protein